MTWWHPDLPRIVRGRPRKTIAFKHRPVHDHVVSIRDLLRDLPVFDRPLPTFAPGNTPEHPNDLFASWLGEAIGAGVVEPHAMTLSTVGADGLPDTRVVVIREVDHHGWQFAADSGSAKGRQVARNPVAALGFYWREQGRQVRVRGRIESFDRATCNDDFLTRPIGSRVACLASPQSQVLVDPSDLDRALVAAEDTVQRDPQVTYQNHTVYAIVPVSVEFWQGDADRRHVRLCYRRVGDSWVKELLWP